MGYSLSSHPMIRDNVAPAGVSITINSSPQPFIGHGDQTQQQLKDNPVNTLPLELLTGRWADE
jgi:hypothetical protein